MTSRTFRTSGSVRSSRRGISRVEVIAVAAMVGLVVMLLLLAMPGQRENARLIRCRSNLGQIGLALLAYGNAFQGALPPVADPLPSQPSPVSTWLRVLVEPDFQSLSANRPPTIDPNGPAVVPHRIGGLLCPTDPSLALTGSTAEAPISYRLNAGDSPRGLNGPFAPGVVRTLTEVEQADGQSYTAAMAERLLGDGQPSRSIVNYRRLDGSLAAESTECPDSGEWQGDAGFTWASNGWASNLYNHAIPPNADRSCVDHDGQTGLIGSSSGHAGQVHILLLDGGVRSYKATVNPQIWKALGTVGSRQTDLQPASEDRGPE